MSTSGVFWKSTFRECSSIELQSEGERVSCIFIGVQNYFSPDAGIRCDSLMRQPAERAD